LKSIGIKQSVRLCDICAKDSRLCDQENVPYQTTQITHGAVIQRWVTLCTSISDNMELIKEVVGGIPNTMRGVIWAELTDACDIIQKNSDIYGLYKNKPISDEIATQLDLDVPRTFSNFPKFGQEGDNALSLRNVLTAYANFNPEMGYCQGMTFLVGVLLMHTDEESSFWILFQILKKYRLSIFYQQDPSNIYIQNFKTKFVHVIPDLSIHMENEGCDAEVFATLWIRTIFASDLEISKVFRIWDVFFVLEIDFLVDFILCIFKLLKGEIILRKGHDLLLYITKQLPNMININFDNILKESVSTFLNSTTEK